MGLLTASFSLSLEPSNPQLSRTHSNNTGGMGGRGTSINNGKFAYVHTNRLMRKHIHAFMRTRDTHLPGKKPPLRGTTNFPGE